MTNFPEGFVPHVQKKSCDVPRCRETYAGSASNLCEIEDGANDDPACVHHGGKPDDTVPSAPETDTLSPNPRP